MIRNIANAPLKARNGHTVKIIAACRVSDPRAGKQDIRSLADQEASYREWINSNLDLPYELEVISGSGSGELLNREEYLRLISCIESRQYDLVLSESLGRITRRIHAHLICELCEDMGTRLITFEDNVDTASPSWRDASIFAAWHHERSNRDTSDRIKRTHRNRFTNGGCFACPIFGYIKPPGAKSDAEVMKDPVAIPIYEEWFRMLDEENASFADVVRRLKAQGQWNLRKPCHREKHVQDGPLQ